MCDPCPGSYNLEGPEGVKWELGFGSFWAGKMGFVHWDWDFTTGNGTNTLENGNGISLFVRVASL